MVVLRNGAKVLGKVMVKSLEIAKKNHNLKFSLQPAVSLHSYHRSILGHACCVIQWFFNSLTRHRSVDKLEREEKTDARNRIRIPPAVRSYTPIVVVLVVQIHLPSPVCLWERLHYVSRHHSPFCQGWVQLLFITFWRDIFNSLWKREEIIWAHLTVLLCPLWNSGENFSKPGVCRVRNQNKTADQYSSFWRIELKLKKQIGKNKRRLGAWHVQAKNPDGALQGWLGRTTPRFSLASIKVFSPILSDRQRQESNAKHQGLETCVCLKIDISSKCDFSFSNHVIMVQKKRHHPDPKMKAIVLCVCCCSPAGRATASPWCTVCLFWFTWLVSSHHNQLIKAWKTTRTKQNPAPSSSKLG